MSFIVQTGVVLRLKVDTINNYTRKTGLSRADQGIWSRIYK